MANILLDAYDATGHRLTWSEFRAVESNGHGSSGISDMLVDSTTLRGVSMWPLAQGSSGATASLTVPDGRHLSLAMPWRTSDGYSELIIDLPSTSGRYDFGSLAAHQAMKDLAAIKAERPWYVPSTAEQQSEAQAASLLARSDAATNATTKGSLAAQALDAAAHAEVLALKESGLQNHAHAGASQWGITFDSPSAKNMSKVASMYGDDGWVRLVFDPGTKPSDYKAAIDAAHANGLHVLGELLDSYEMSSMSLSAFQARTKQFVDGLPGVDKWEVGNEVNGSWLGDPAQTVAKVKFAAEYVQAHSSAPVLLTLFWQMGEDRAQDQVFTWAAKNLATILPSVDEIGLSMYPGQAPMGTAFGRVMDTLHNTFPGKAISITELGYGQVGGDDQGATWWWGKAGDFSAQGPSAVAVADLYQSAIMGVPYANGGAYWWYGLQQAMPGTAVGNALAHVHADAVLP